VFQSTARGFGSAKCIDFQSSDLLLIHTHTHTRTEQKESVIAAFVLFLFFVTSENPEITANTYTVLYRQWRMLF